MSNELWVDRLEREAAEKLDALMALPLPEHELDVGSDEFFDPWRLFPLLYGTYSNDFDECALDVLRELDNKTKVRDDLGAEMFREMLCRLNLCTYGTSPRVSFPTSPFFQRLPKLIALWEAYSAMQWKGVYSAVQWKDDA